MSEVIQKSKLAKQAAQTMGNLTTEQKNAACSLWQMPNNGAASDYRSQTPKICSEAKN